MILYDKTSELDNVDIARAFPNALLSGAAPRNSNYTKNIFLNK